MRERDAELKAEKPEHRPRAGGGTTQGRDDACQASTAYQRQTGNQASTLMEEVVRRENVVAAYQRVVGNGGAPGIDGVTVEALKGYCQAHWETIRADLLTDRYQPQPVRRVEIPKPGGKGKRMLGIPTVVDRLIQQALLQALQPLFDPTFSADSYGFRPGRSAHQAVGRARQHIQAGYRWVVDLDLEKFFDRVQHDVLMARVARRIEDKRVLRLIRRYLQAGMMEGGLVTRRTEGTPQGGPLSPLLSNTLLDELDKELAQRGHRFVRYADDCNVYVQSKAAGDRVLASLDRWLSKRLRLCVNREKSAVDRPWNRTFLGYSVTPQQDARLKVAPASIQRLKGKIRQRLRSGRGRALEDVATELTPLIRGWTAYFRHSEVKAAFETLDAWLRRKLRSVLWRQWKSPPTRARKLRQLGLDPARAYASAYNGRGPWWNAGASHMNQAISVERLQRTGLMSFVQEYRRLKCTS